MKFSSHARFGPISMVARWESSREGTLNVFFYLAKKQMWDKYFLSFEEIWIMKLHKTTEHKFCLGSLCLPSYLSLSHCFSICAFLSPSTPISCFCSLFVYISFSLSLSPFSLCFSRVTWSLSSNVTCTLSVSKSTVLSKHLCPYSLPLQWLYF